MGVQIRHSTYIYGLYSMERSHDISFRPLLPSRYLGRTSLCQQQNWQHILTDTTCNIWVETLSSSYTRLIKLLIDGEVFSPWHRGAKGILSELAYPGVIVQHQFSWLPGNSCGFLFGHNRVSGGRSTSWNSGLVPTCRICCRQGT